MNLVELELSKYRVQGVFLGHPLRLFQVNEGPNHSGGILPPGEVLVVTNFTGRTDGPNEWIFVIGKTNVRRPFSTGRLLDTNCAPKKPANWDDYQSLIQAVPAILRNEEDAYESVQPVQAVSDSRRIIKRLFLSYAPYWARKLFLFFERKAAGRTSS